MKASTFVLTVPALFIPALALAQGAGVDTSATAGGDATATATATTPPPPPPPPATTATATVAAATPPPAAATPDAASGKTDHEQVVGHLAAGYLGVSQVPIAQIAGTGVTEGTVSAPVIGVRYWLNNRMGVDVGLGIGVSSATGSVTNAGVTTDNNTPAVVGFAVHGGVPLALAYSQHFAFELVPEVNFGYAGTSISGAPDIGLNGIRLDIGARIGAELQFGFIGIPQLSLQGSVGLSFRYDTVWASQNNNGANLSTIGVGTTFQNDPWAIFTNSVSALYYF